MVKSITQLFLALILFISIPDECLSQSNIIDGYLQLNRIDSILAAKDTIEAIDEYEKITNFGFVKAGRHLALSDIYFSLNQKEKSKIELLLAVDKGILGLSYIDDNQSRLFKQIKENHGRKFLTKLKSNHAKGIKQQLDQHGGMLARIKDIFLKDQEIRKNKYYKTCKKYNFNRRLSFAYDSSQIQEEMIACFNEFRDKDSIILSDFVNIIDSIGYVPGKDMIYGMVPIAPIICHLAHFNFKGLEDKLLYSVFKGTLSPEVYAWYIGYKEEYFLLEKSFHFTNAEQEFDKMPTVKINEINQLRKSIGIKSIPATLWNSRIY